MNKLVVSVKGVTVRSVKLSHFLTLRRRVSSQTNYVHVIRLTIERFLILVYFVRMLTRMS